jgi:uncharacterized protein YjiS (DUF1127 family)
MSSVLTRIAHPGRHAHALESGPSLLTRALSFIAQEIRTRRDLRALSSLDDAALRDIGLARGGLEDAVRYGRSQGGLFGTTALIPDPACDRAVEPPAFTEWR